VLGRDTEEVLMAIGYSREEIEALEGEGAVGGPVAGTQGSFMS
jgi:hypothetical protein